MMKLAFSVLVLLGLMAWPAAAQSPRPSVTILATFDYHLDSALLTSANGISNTGVVAGSYSSSTGTFGFLQYADGSFSEPIAGPDSTYTVAQGINSAGLVGGYFTDRGGSHGFFDDGTTFQPYDFPGAKSTSVIGLNDGGDFVGTFVADGKVQGFASIGGATVVIAVPDADETIPTGINNHGEIVGYFSSRRPVGSFGFYRDAAGNYTFPIPAPRLWAINDRGDIAGDAPADPASGSCHGLILHLPKHVLTFDIPGAYSTAATGINNAGEICGYYYDTQGGGVHGFTAQLTK